MSDSSIAILRPTWDVAGSAYKAFDALKALVRVASQDDVQPQAILAAEAIGAGLLAAPKRIAEAIESLGGNQSVKLESIKVNVGLVSGGTCAAIRQSTPLLQFYLFCTACKPVFLDDEIGALLFEMMVETGLYSKTPVTASQLARLINQIGGHAEDFVPMEQMQEVACQLDAHGSDPDAYRRMDTTALARLFVYVFEKYRNQDIVSMTLTGHDHGVWICTAILWLLGDDACLEINSRVVIGNGDAKVTVVLQPSSPLPWQLALWERSQSPTEYVFPFHKDEERLPLSRLPLANACSYFDSCYWLHYDNTGELDLRPDCKRVAGELAGALIMLSAKYGKLTNTRKCCKTLETSCCKMGISKLASRTWLTKYSQLVADYGWPLMPPQMELYNRMRITLLDATTTVVECSAVERRQQQRQLRSFCEEYISEQVGFVSPDDILTPAMHIAMDAILTCSSRVMSGMRYITLPDSLTLAKGEEIICDLLFSGLEVSSFLSGAFAQLLPGISDTISSALILSCSGYVAGMSILWHTSTEQRGSVAIDVLRGHITKDGIRYAGIRESGLTSRGKMQAASDCPTMTFSGSDVRFNSPRPRMGLDGSRTSFEALTSSIGDWLEMKQYVVHTLSSVTERPSRRRISWTAVIQALATARPIDGSGHLNSLAEGELRDWAERKARTTGLSWAPPFAGVNTDDNTCFVVDGAGDEMTRMFAAATYGGDSLFSECRPVYIRHSGTVLQSLNTAEEGRASRWVMIL